MKTTGKFLLTRDDDGHWYLIHSHEKKAFETWLENGPYWENYDGPCFDENRIDGPGSIYILEWSKK